ncbi:amino acid adenylation domain-containing protein [Micromonospora profundi]|uniref:non-ribosomal peptide synthetase n=1 Tax=Micromonospora profundi TaxID=1420889 RepID=UPI0033A45C11
MSSTDGRGQVAGTEVLPPSMAPRPVAPVDRVVLMPAALPSWTTTPRTGTDLVDLPIPPNVTAALAAASAELEQPVPVLVATAHAAVLAALGGTDAQVVIALAGQRTGFGPPVGPPEGQDDGGVLVDVREGTWRDLVGRAAAALRAPGAGRIDDLAADHLRLVVDGDDDTGPGDSAAASIAWRRDALVVRYRTDVIDEGCARRLAGYHLTALRLLIERPDADFRATSLVGEDERRQQLIDLAGPVRDLPDRRWHELFEEKVRQHPDRTVAVLGARTCSYAELNRRANRVAHAILARELGHEAVVAVVCERDLDWMAAVVGVLKAGAVYLPIEPHFPADRILTLLRRSGCRLALTGPGVSLDLDAATVADVLALADVPGEGHPQDDPQVPVSADQLAYLYFTSGSTGTPKGAMCEHAGMLNHLLAKAADLEITETDVVAQTAPQCFDISLWQLLVAPLVGGCTRLVEQEVILEVPRFVDTVLDGQVDVVQLVPSYLDVVLAHLEQHPRPLTRLRYVSVTGEAVRKDLVQRWLDRYPAIAVMNAYGLTETSDDTNHEIVRRVPDTERVPLGRPLPNVRIHIVDPQLRPVPLGAPGEIVFSGICVGRGYVNDEMRTAEAFLPDPQQPGRRLYRSGDFGRWLPDGRLDFLGRRDAQIKIRGFRIEIGEIENRLVALPGVRDAAVVAVGGELIDGQLVGYYTGVPQAAKGILRDLAALLPEYMVPAHVHHLSRLPLTDNGKVDRRALVAWHTEATRPAEAVDPPRTLTERRIAAAWAQALKLPEEQIGRDRDFFARGGTSLAAVRAVASLDGLCTLTQMNATPVLADLAAVVDRVHSGRRPPVVTSAGRPPRPASAATDTGASQRPPIIEVPESADAQGWLREHRDALREVQRGAGALLIRGAGLRDHRDVAAAAAVFIDEPMAEHEAFARRHTYAPTVYSSSEWPADQPMCMHHELSYSARFPRTMVFGCLRTPSSSGAIAIADAELVLRSLPQRLVDRFEEQGWILRRTYGDSVGVPWREALCATDVGSAEAYAARHGIELRWSADGRLSTTQRRAAVVRHPDTGRRCWFNQIAFLNEWTLDPVIRDYLLLEFGPGGLPFNTTYGDGEPINDPVVQTINAVYERCAVREPWQDGDLLVVDNIRMAHSRDTYEGAREIVVVMGDPLTPADCGVPDPA